MTNDPFLALLTVVYIAIIGGVMLATAMRAALSNPALRRSWEMLVLAACLWIAMVAAKPLYLDKVLPPGDAILHCAIGHTIADHILDRDWNGACQYFGAGNRGYRFLLGLFYAASSGSEVVVYAINGGLAFCGLVSLVTLFCSMSGCARCPWWVIALTLCLFSPMFWSTTNLKEGPVVWGICMSLQLLNWHGQASKRRPLLSPLTGLVVAGFLRPHIAVTWAVALGFGVAIARRKFGMAALAAVACVGGGLVFQFLVPGLVDSFLNEGIVETLEHEYEVRSDIGTSAIQYAGGAPTPGVSGFLLLMVRPLPNEVANLGFLVAGLEAWLLTAVLCVNWLRHFKTTQVLRCPLVMTMLVALVLFSLEFSYVYNMGLMVRQRLQVLPAILALAVLPALQSRRAATGGKLSGANAMRMRAHAQRGGLVRRRAA